MLWSRLGLLLLTMACDGPPALGRIMVVAVVVVAVVLEECRGPKLERRWIGELVFGTILPRVHNAGIIPNQCGSKQESVVSSCYLLSVAIGYHFSFPIFSTERNFGAFLRCFPSFSVSFALF